jgi:hypothetical protein
MAATGSTAPTDATTALAAAWKNMGGQTEAGVTIKQATTTSEKKFYGSPAVQRTLITDQKFTVSAVFGEVNARTMEVFFRKALNSITPAVTTGAFSVTAGTYVRQLYALVVDMVDGTNHIRYYMPSVEVVNQGDIKIANSETLEFSVEMSAYPDTSGNAIYTYFALPYLG